jgi:hypothetical protein
MSNDDNLFGFRTRKDKEKIFLNLAEEVLTYLDDKELLDKLGGVKNILANQLSSAYDEGYRSCLTLTKHRTAVLEEELKKIKSDRASMLLMHRESN